MDYKKHYDLLIARGRTRMLPDGYTEKHHVVPRCIGGGNEKSNLVILTAEEHFVAHLLLMKVYPEIHGLAMAINAMSMSQSRRKLKNKSFGWARRRAAKAISISNTGRVRSEKFRRELSIRNTGNILSQHTKDKIGAANKGNVPANKGQARSAVTRRKISDSKYKTKFVTPLGEYNDIHLAAKDNKCNINTVRRRCGYIDLKWKNWYFVSINKVEK